MCLLCGKIYQKIENCTSQVDQYPHGGSGAGATALNSNGKRTKKNNTRPGLLLFWVLPSSSTLVLETHHSPIRGRGRPTLARHRRRVAHHHIR